MVGGNGFSTLSHDVKAKIPTNPINNIFFIIPFLETVC